MNAILLTTIENREKDNVELNRPFSASHSGGTKPPCWRAKVALGQDKQRKLPFKIMYVFCLFCPSTTFVLQRGGFVPREWLTAKGLFRHVSASANILFKTYTLIFTMKTKIPRFIFAGKFIQRKRISHHIFCISLVRRCNLYRHTLICQYLLRITMEVIDSFICTSTIFLPTFARIR